MKLRGVVTLHERVEPNNAGEVARRIIIKTEPQTGLTHTKAAFILDEQYAIQTFPIDQHVELVINPVDAPPPKDESDPNQLRLDENPDAAEMEQEPAPVPE